MKHFFNDEVNSILVFIIIFMLWVIKSNINDATIIYVEIKI